MGEGITYKNVQFYSPLQENLNGCGPLLLNFFWRGEGGADTLKGNWHFPVSTVSDCIVRTVFWPLFLFINNICIGWDRGVG